VYYHILVGGGFDPYFPAAPVVPAHYKPGAERPAPGEYFQQKFNWTKHSADYEYFLARGGRAALERYLVDDHPWCTELAANGEWTLFERR
jgi:hypothetical protein